MSEHYHFVGIGGIGMGALASLLLDKGFRVSGSDLKESQMTNSLKAKGATIFIGHAPEHVGQADFVIFSSAVNEENPELKQARQAQIPVIRRANLLANLMQNHIGITVAGAHGKTTTTSMISKILIDAGLNPTTAVGGIVGGTTNNAHLGQGKYFVSEVDESDGSFLYFKPQFTVITNIDFEHIDYYGNWDNIVKAYQEFVSGVDDAGCIVACVHDERLLKIVKSSKKKHRTYGINIDADINAKDVKVSEFGSTFNCFFANKFWGCVQLIVPGHHNILNAMAAIGIATELGISQDIILKSLKDFRGVQRRFQLLTKSDDIRVIDDYGHHPTEISAVLQSAAGLNKKRLLVVFQPHRYTRLRFLMKEFAHSLQACDALILTDVYAASEKPIEGISSLQLLDDIKSSGHRCAEYCSKDKILEVISSKCQRGDVIIFLGAGDITKIAHQFADQLNEKSKDNPSPNAKVGVFI